MSVTIRHGSPQFPAVTGSIPSSTHETMDAAVHTLQEHKDAWVALSNRERIAILDKLINDLAAIEERRKEHTSATILASRRSISLVRTRPLMLLFSELERRVPGGKRSASLY